MKKMEPSTLVRTTGVKRKALSDSEPNAFHKELAEVSCPICMDHPHNAVLLICTSHEMGCRSYLCDTSYRHSNCLDRFKKSNADSASDSTSSTGADEHVTFSFDVTVTTDTENNIISVRQPDRAQENNIQDDTQDLETNNDEKLNVPLKCPLCRGDVIDWKILKGERKYLNSKERSCTQESCSFIGNYKELRQHARQVHPTSRPCDVDPSRERVWRRLENEREYGDIVSAIRSAMPNAHVVGDYAIESDDVFPTGRRNDFPATALLNTILVIQMMYLRGSGSQTRGQPRALSSHNQSVEGFSEPRFLWGENLLGHQQDDDDDDDDDDELNVRENDGDDENDGNDENATSPRPVRRRRRARSL